MAEAQQAREGVNGFDEAIVEGIVARLEGFVDELATERGEYMNRCRQIRGDIKDAVQAAKDEHGIPKKALRTVIKRRALLAKVEDLETELEADDQTAFRQLRVALGDFADLPLGQHAEMAARMDADARRGGRRKRKDTDGEAATT